MTTHGRPTQGEKRHTSGAVGMKVYIIGGSEEEALAMTEFCQQNGWDLRVSGRIGRPKADYPVQKVVDTYKREKTVRGVARMLDIPAPTVSRILKQAGALERDLRPQQKEHEGKDGN